MKPLTLSDPGLDAAIEKLGRQKFQRKSLPFISSPGVFTLLGPRRIGKSTQFRVWQKKLLDEGVSLNKIAHVDAEIFENWKELLEALENLKVDFLFIDEATAPKDWPRALKILIDRGTLDKTCIWLTGSNAFDLKNMSEKLPGRRGENSSNRDVELLPLNFREFFEVHKKFKKSPGECFSNFLKFGGYPIAVSESLQFDRPSVDLMQTFVDVALGATTKSHRSPRLTGALVERLWLNLGGLTSYHNLSKALDAGSHPIIRQYVEILEGCFALLIAEKFNAKTRSGFLKKEKKIYFFDPLVMASLVSWAQNPTQGVNPHWMEIQMSDSAKFGKLLETLVASEFRKKKWPFYYDHAFGGEIDFVVPLSDQEILAFEVKKSEPSLAEITPLKAYPNKSKVLIYEKFENQKPPGFESLLDWLLK